MILSVPKGGLTRRAAASALMRLGAGLTGLGDAVLRPRPVRLLGETDPSGSEALVRRVVSHGTEVRVELVLADGRELWAQAGRDEAQLLELRAGQILAVALPAARELPRAA